jgi:hypothetical protein
MAKNLYSVVTADAVYGRQPFLSNGWLVEAYTKGAE